MTNEVYDMINIKAVSVGKSKSEIIQEIVQNRVQIIFVENQYIEQKDKLGLELCDFISVNACKNILVVVLMMDRPLCATVLHALCLEWGNPNCSVPVLCALIGDCIFRSTKNNPLIASLNYAIF